MVIIKVRPMKEEETVEEEKGEYFSKERIKRLREDDPEKDKLWRQKEKDIVSRFMSDKRSWREVVNQYQQEKDKL